MFLNNNLCHCIIFSAVISCKYIFTKDKAISLVLKCKGLFHVISFPAAFISVPSCQFREFQNKCWLYFCKIYNLTNSIIWNSGIAINFFKVLISVTCYFVSYYKLRIKNVTLHINNRVAKERLEGTGQEIMDNFNVFSNTSLLQNYWMMENRKIGLVFRKKGELVALIMKWVIL